ncbi:hypothetical protein HC928_13020 [bacterium]|nr:hypothetical protein [bacterium]
MADRNAALPKVYLQCRMSDIDNIWYQAEILGGNVIPMEDTYSYGWANDHLRFELVILRREYFSVDLLPIELTSKALTTATTDPVVLRSYDALDNSIYVDIAANQLDGDLPLPIYIQVENVMVETDTNLSRLTFLTNWHSSNTIPIDLDTYTPTEQTEEIIIEPDMAHANAAKGNTFRIFYIGVLIDTKVRVVTRDSVGLIYDEGVYQFPSSAALNLYDLGTVTLPPYSALIPNTTGYEIVLQFEALAGGEVSYETTQILAVPYNSIRKLTNTGFGISSISGKLIDDQLKNNTYSTNAAGRRNIRNYSSQGELWLMPNKAHRLYVLHTYAISFELDDGRISMQLFYRKRKTFL